MCPRLEGLKERGDMDFALVEEIAQQLPEGIIVQFHNNGEPLLYPQLKEVLALFKGQIRNFDTNGKLLLGRADVLIDNMEVLTLSVFQNDPEAYDQWIILKQFVKYKGDRKPRLVIRCLGDVKWENYLGWGEVALRTLHSPCGRTNYIKHPIIPEAGICLDALSHLSIERDGECFMCVRFNPEGKSCIGDATKQRLSEIWAGKPRAKYILSHIAGKRSEIELCKDCDYWGVPMG